MSVSGAFLTAKIGSQPVEIEDNNLWKAAESVKELDRTVGSDAGFRNRDAGLQDITITIHGFLDLATLTGGAYTELRAGTLITQLKLFYRATDTDPAFNIPLGLVLDSDLGGEVDGLFEWNATIKNKGSYAYNAPDNGS